MTSADMITIANNDTEYRIYVMTQLGILKDNQAGLKERVDKLEVLIVHVHDEQAAINAKFDMLLWGTGIMPPGAACFATIAAITLGAAIYGLVKSVITLKYDTAETARQVKELLLPELKLKD